MAARKSGSTVRESPLDSRDDAHRTLGVLGLGIIGSRVAQAARKEGLSVAAWNRTPRRGVSTHGSPEAVARAARVIQIFVTDDAALASVVAAITPALGKNHVVVNSSTVSLEATRQTERKVAGCGAAFLDAPFTGSRGAADAGQLVYYVGGSPDILKSVEWALAPSAKTIVSLGQVGDATVVKIATNLISAIVVEALAEAWALVETHGIDGERFLAAMEHNANQSTLCRMKLPSIIAGDYTPHFSLKNMWKDSGFAERLAHGAGLDVPALSVVRARMGRLVGQGHSEDDFSVLAAAYPRSSVPRRTRPGRS